MDFFISSISFYNEPYFKVDKINKTMYSSITGKTIQIDEDNRILITGNSEILPFSFSEEYDRHLNTHNISYRQIADMVDRSITASYVAGMLIGYAMLNPSVVGGTQAIYDLVSTGWSIISESILNKKSGGIKIVVWEKTRRTVRQGKVYYIPVPYVKSVSRY